MGKIRIELIDGLDYDKVIFRNEIANLIRHDLKSKIDYIKSIEINTEGGFIVNYSVDNRLMSYYDRYNAVAKRIVEFCKIEQRDDKLKQLGI